MRGCSHLALCYRYLHHHCYLFLHHLLHQLKHQLPAEFDLKVLPLRTARGPPLPSHPHKVWQLQQQGDACEHVSSLVMEMGKLFASCKHSNVTMEHAKSKNAIFAHHVIILDFLHLLSVLLCLW